MRSQILCNIDDIKESCSKGFTLENGMTLFVVKKEGLLFVYKNSCPHLGIELEWQEDQFLDSNKTLIQCSTHGALFIIESGKCIAGPCINKTLQAIPFAIEGYRVVVSY